MDERKLRKKTNEKSAVRSKENLINPINENDKLAPSNKIKKLNKRHNIKLVERSENNENAVESTVGRQLKSIDIRNQLNGANKTKIKLDQKSNNKLTTKTQKVNEFVDVFKNQTDLIEKSRYEQELKEREERLFALKLRSIGRWKFKIDCPYVDFVYELGYKKYIHLALTKVFGYLNDKDLSAAFCVSNMWNSVLSQNGYTKKRLTSYLKKQKKLKSRIGLENYPAIEKKEIKSKRRVLGEMTNQKVMNR